MAVRTVDDYINNTAWVARIEGFFDRVDQNKNGTLEVADFTALLETFNRELKPDPKVYENLRQVVMEHITAMGVTPGKKVTKEEHVKNVANMSVAEHTKRLNGEKMSLAKVNDALYDLFDSNRDGAVTLEEFRTVMKIVYGCDDEAADATFRRIDTNKNGKIERKELTDHELKYWYDLNDEASKDFYGAKYTEK